MWTSRAFAGIVERFVVCRTWHLPSGASDNSVLSFKTAHVESAEC
jgi:hypothetical protein